MGSKSSWIVSYKTGYLLPFIAFSDERIEFTLKKTETGAIVVYAMAKRIGI